MIIESKVIRPIHVHHALRDLPSVHGQIKTPARKTTPKIVVVLSGTSNRRPPGWLRDPNRDPDDFMPTWEETRTFLAHLYTFDPDMKALTYRNARDFHLRTGKRFNPFPPVMYPHGRRLHNWQDGLCRCGAVNLSASDVDMLCPST